MIEWPLGSFACRVGSDESLCKAMENMFQPQSNRHRCFGKNREILVDTWRPCLRCTLSLAAKISQGARGKALEGYSELLSLVVRDGIVDPEERQALSHYRARHAVPDTEHWRMLDELGWTLEEFDQGSSEIPPPEIVHITASKLLALAPSIGMRSCTRWTSLDPILSNGLR